MKLLNARLKNIKSLVSSVVLSCFLLISSSSAFASGSEHSNSGHHAETVLPSFGEFLLEKKIYWLNFIVFTALLVFILRKVFIKAWVARRANYIEAINSGRKLLEESQAQLSTAQQLLTAVPAEVSSMQARMLKEVNFDVERIIQEASEKAEKIKNQASQSAAVEKRAAIQEYQEKLVEQAILRARAKVSGLLSAEVDSRLKDRVVSSVSGLLN